MKMNQTWKKQDIELKPGMSISGKWHKRSFIIKRKLGSGAIGSVFLCTCSGKEYALKISDNSTSMTMEVNVLKSLQKVQGNRLGPSLFDVDDWITPRGTKYSFYVMEYVKGETMGSYIKRNGNAWVGVFMLQLLDDLERLHQAGWVFGDLKAENLLVLASPPRVRFIDVGGTTQKGRAIKEYTEFYDRGYWGMGSRRAEPSYDLFAFVMVFINLYFPKRFDKGPNGERTLYAKLKEVRALRVFSPCLIKAIQGKYQSSAQMKNEIAGLMYQAQRTNSAKRTAYTRKAKTKSPVIVETNAIFLLALFYYLSSLLVP
ncbi:protein kinase domain-containing protein [Virgibacillus oceani]|uniref:Serine/threonine-protein kinase YabT n=1 Tax=Virgibacillus oceani TaxID=1479511 RepID=A0A917HJU1_9BACI|nr:protein kinase [Virgibacillus oceani]GGG81977.1 putative serine/threonine-protein kinase YabT [Virgibacillus oceani]